MRNTHVHTLTVQPDFHGAHPNGEGEIKRPIFCCCCFLVSIQLSFFFRLKVQCVKIQPTSCECVLKENRGIVQNMTAGFTYCSTGCLPIWNTHNKNHFLAVCLSVITLCSLYLPGQVYHVSISKQSFALGFWAKTDVYYCSSSTLYNISFGFSPPGRFFFFPFFFSQDQLWSSAAVAKLNTLASLLERPFSFFSWLTVTAFVYPWYCNENVSICVRVCVYGCVWTHNGGMQHGCVCVCVCVH